MPARLVRKREIQLTRPIYSTPSTESTTVKATCLARSGKESAKDVRQRLTHNLLLFPPPASGADLLAAPVSAALPLPRLVGEGRQTRQRRGGHIQRRWQPSTCIPRFPTTKVYQRYTKEEGNVITYREKESPIEEQVLEGEADLKRGGGQRGCSQGGGVLGGRASERLEV